MRFEPHEYQRDGVERLLNQDAIALLWEMGLGKSVVTLTAVHELKYHRYQVARTLVIAPKKVAESTWTREAQKWDHLQSLRVVRVLGTAKQRIRALNTPGDVYVINRDNVKWLVDHYRNAWPFDMVVCDEFSSFKNPTANRTKALRLVRPHIKRFVGLTGTPAPNGLMDLWSQVQLLDGGERLGKSIYAYRQTYFQPDKRGRDQVYSYKPNADAEQAIWERISDICVSLRAEDYLQLPDITYHTIPVALDPKAKATYDRLEREAVLELAEAEEINAGSAAALTNKLLQLCNGAVYDENHKAYEIHDCKLQAFLEALEGVTGHGVLVFYNFQHDLQRLKAALAKIPDLRVRELRTPADEEAWNRREVDVLLAHPASAAYGLNLQEGGNHVIWYGLNWSLELYQQANARLHRQGQTQKVIIHHLVTEGGVDEDVMAALQDKGETQDRLLDALKARIQRVKGRAGQQAAG